MNSMREFFVITCKCLQMGLVDSHTGALNCSCEVSKCVVDGLVRNALIARFLSNKTFLDSNRLRGSSLTPILSNGMVAISSTLAPSARELLNIERGQPNLIDKRLQSCPAAPDFEMDHVTIPPHSGNR
jgi:hypothetical protein